MMEWAEWVSCTMSSERVEKVRTSWLTFAFNVKRGLIKEPPILARRGGGFINPGLTLAAVFLPKSDTKSKKCKEIIRYKKFLAGVKVQRQNAIWRHSTNIRMITNANGRGYISCKLNSSIMYERYMY